MSAPQAGRVYPLWPDLPSRRTADSEAALAHATAEDAAGLRAGGLIIMSAAISTIGIGALLIGWM